MINFAADSLEGTIIVGSENIHNIFYCPQQVLPHLSLALLLLKTIPTLLSAQSDVSVCIDKEPNEALCEIEIAFGLFETLNDLCPVIGSPVANLEPIARQVDQVSAQLH
jgi:hypothetical protein